MKKGFTLVELLATIIVLAIVALIAYPIIGNVIETSRESADHTSLRNYAKAIQTEVFNYQSINGTEPTSIDDLNIEMNTDSISCEEIVLPLAGNKLELRNCRINDSTKLYCYTNGEAETCGEVAGEVNIPNAPELHNGLTPVKYDGTNWIVADTTQEWYNYDNKEWANAVVLNTTKTAGQIVQESDIDLWYVWIPRYKYQLFNVDGKLGKDPQLINIKFEKGTASTGTVSCTTATNQTDEEGNILESSEICINAENGNWYTHPAFTFGEEELTGIWVGKFEVSTTDSKCRDFRKSCVNGNLYLPYRSIKMMVLFTSL